MKRFHWNVSCTSYAFQICPAFICLIFLTPVCLWDQRAFLELYVGALCVVKLLCSDFGKLHFWMSALKFINSSYQQKNSAKQHLHNNENLGRLETNSQNALLKTKTIKPETKFQNWNWKQIQNLGNELLNIQKKQWTKKSARRGYENQILQKSHPYRLKRRHRQKLM